MGAFSITLTTTALNRSRSWWFATCSCKPIAGGQTPISHAASAAHRCRYANAHAELVAVENLFLSCLFCNSTARSNRPPRAPDRLWRRWLGNHVVLVSQLLLKLADLTLRQQLVRALAVSFEGRDSLLE